MKHAKSLLFVSPIPWGFHNEQMQSQASLLSRHYNVFFIDFSRINSVRPRDIVFSSYVRKKYFTYLKNLINPRMTIVKKPIFVVFRLFSSSNTFSFINDILIGIQSLFFVIISSGSYDNAVWVSVTRFPKIMTVLPGFRWYFDFFDRFEDFENKRNSLLYYENETWLLKHAKNIFVNSTFYYTLATSVLKSIHRSLKNVVVTPVGYVLRPFLRVVSKAGKGKTVVGYYGALSERLDYRLIYDVVRGNKDVLFMFVGPVYAYNRWLTPVKKDSPEDFIKLLMTLPNVKIMPYVSDKNRQRKTLAQFTVGWIPYDTTIFFNYYSTPTKFYEYCAVGLPVISTPIPTLTEYPAFVKIFRSAKEFSNILQNALSTNNESAIQTRKAFASSHDVQVKISSVVSTMEKNKN